MITGLVLLAALANAETPAPPGFEAEVEVILRVVDVRVTDREGNFLSGLERDSFQVLEDGEARPIETFEEIRYQDLEETGPAIASSGFLSPPRRFLFVLDRTRRGRPVVFRNVRRRLEEFVRNELRPGDLAAVAQYSQQKQVVKDFSADPERIVANIMGGDVNDKGKLRTFFLEAPDDQWDPIDSPFMAAVSAALGQDVKMGLGEKLDRFFQADELERFFRFLEALGRGLDVVPGPKAMVLVSAGFEANRVASRQNELNDRAIEAMAAIAGAGAQLYMVDPHGLIQVGMNPRQRYLLRSFQDSLIWLADQAGGEVYRNSNDYRTAFRHIAGQESGYYSLGFRSQERRDGKRHKVEVKVAQEDARVWFPETWMAPSEEGPNLETVRRVELIKMASRRQRHDGLDVGLAARVLRSEDDEPSLLLGIHVGAGKGERDVHVQSESWRGPFRAAHARVGPEERMVAVELAVSTGPVSVALAVRDREDQRMTGTAFLDLDVLSFQESPSASLWSPSGESGLPAPAVAGAGCLPVRLDVFAPPPAEDAGSPPVEVVWTVEGQPSPLEVKESAWSRSPGVSRFEACLDVSALPVGLHRLQAKLEDSTSQKSRTLRLPFTRQEPPPDPSP